MNVIKATRDFERWLAKQIPLVRRDVALKHAHMAESPFAFFRATFYRWLQLWHANCADVVGAPKVLTVGDLHIENFGTWRDLEGRLIWGVNDLDEVWPGPYTLDLIRLTTSAYLAISGEHLGLTKREASEAIEEGYRDALNDGGQAFILAEHHQWLRLMALSKLRDPVHFWAKMMRNPPYTAKPPAEVRRLLEASFPNPHPQYVLKRRIAGLGSLGHPRILALSSWKGAYVAREAKAIRTSAWAWYRGTSGQIYTAQSWCRPRFACRIRACDSTGTGWCAGWLRIVRELRSLPCPRGATKRVCSIAWAGNPPICISPAAA